MKRFLFCGFLLSHSFTGAGQSVISGHIYTKAGAPIAGASITLTVPGIDNLLAFDISNREGFFFGKNRQCRKQTANHHQSHGLQNSG